MADRNAERRLKQPDFRTPIGIDGKTPIASFSGNNGRSPLRRDDTRPELLFGPTELSSTESIQDQVSVAASDSSSTERKPLGRALRLRKGAYIYEARPDSKTGKIIIPRTSEMEESLFVEELLFDYTAEVDSSCVGPGKKKQDIILPIGKSAEYGAFTIVLFPAMDADGKEIMVQRLANLNQRRLKKENEVVRFKQALARR